ncbi:MAG: hypothetical protein ACRD2W_05470 [Acidimicrobiales bacterium]
MLAVVLAAAVLITASCSSSNDRSEKAAATVDAVAFRQHMRNLWTDHVAWTRLFIVSAVAGLPDTEATAGRLLQNQTDIGESAFALSRLAVLCPGWRSGGHGKGFY